MQILLDKRVYIHSLDTRGARTSCNTWRDPRWRSTWDGYRVPICFRPLCIFQASKMILLYKYLRTHWNLGNTLQC